MINSSEEVLVTIIIRTKNEERWIKECLIAVFNQSYQNLEVVLVDNCSTDQTVKIAREFPVKVVNIVEFLPGEAINKGIKASSGKIIVCLSGHCIPKNSNWLANLINETNNPNIAGVYGRQEPLSYSSDLDKRDLLTVFGLDRKVQYKDSFFHNANSAFRKEVWEKFQFDERATNIEDRLWGQKVIEAGYQIVYEPEASVFHWHGIHHGLNPERARKIVRILEGMEGLITSSSIDEIENKNIIAIIPIRGLTKKVGKKHLLEYTIQAANACKYIKKVIVSSDNEDTIQIGKNLGANIPFKSPPQLSQDYISITDILHFTLEMIEKDDEVPDIVVLLEESYPFRQPQMITNMIEYLVREGLDTLIAAKGENRGMLIEKEGSINILGDGFMPRKLKTNRTLVGLMGLCCVTHPTYIRQGKMLGERLGIYEIDDSIAQLEIRDQSALNLANQILPQWWNQNYEN